MPIVVTLDRVMADRKISLNDLSEKVGITNVNMSRIKTGRAKGVRFSTLYHMCEVLNCQPGDLLTFVPDGETLDDPLYDDSSQ